MARGNVQLDYLTQHVEADDARYELKNRPRHFSPRARDIRYPAAPDAHAVDQPQSALFRSRRSRARGREHISCVQGVVDGLRSETGPRGNSMRRRQPSNCGNRFTWKTEISGCFRSRYLYLPYATFPAEKQRNSGFMIPEPGESSTKGLCVRRRILLGADGLDGHDHRRFLLQQARLEPKRRVAHAALGERAAGGRLFRRDRSRASAADRARPSSRVAMKLQLLFTALLPGGWRAVADLDQLTSLTFRLAFSETFVAGGKFRSAQHRVSHQ